MPARVSVCLEEAEILIIRYCALGFKLIRVIHIHAVNTGDYRVVSVLSKTCLNKHINTYRSLYYLLGKRVSITFYIQNKVFKVDFCLAVLLAL